MPGILKFLRWAAILIWATVLVAAVAVFAMNAETGLTWTDLAYVAVAGLAVGELWDWME